jgi:hypothetical protein
VWALPTLAIYGERFPARTKGKERSGRFPEAAKAAIERSNLNLRSPFADRMEKKSRSGFIT